MTVDSVDSGLDALCGLKGKAFFGRGKEDRPIAVGKYWRRQTVCVKGLTGKKELNELEGLIVRHEPESDRYGIMVCPADWPGVDPARDALTGKVFALKGANFDVLEDRGSDDGTSSSADEEYQNKIRSRKALFNERMKQVFPGGWPPTHMKGAVRAERAGLPKVMRKYPRHGENPVLIIVGQDKDEDDDECPFFTTMAILNERPALWRRWGVRIQYFKSGESAKACKRCRRLIVSNNFSRIIVTDLREPDIADTMVGEGDKVRNGMDALVQELGSDLKTFVKDGGCLAFWSAQGHGMVEKVLQPLFGDGGLSWRPGKDEQRIFGGFPGNRFTVEKILGQGAADFNFHATACSITAVPEAERLMVASLDDNEARFEDSSETIMAMRREGKGIIAYLGDVNGSYGCAMLLSRLLESPSMHHAGDI